MEFCSPLGFVILLPLLVLQAQAACDATYKYRTYNGSCNNLQNPEWGQTGAVYMRLLPPWYNNDDGHTPRWYQSDGSELPHVRRISVKVHDPGEFYAPGLNQWLMSWGQFLDHDITKTPKDGPGHTCCSEDLVLNGDAGRVFDETELCWPIIIPDGDDYFTDTAYRCKEFYRSNPIYDESGVRQQYNALSPFIDGSQIYGETEELASELRTKSNGKLDTKILNGERFLPADTNTGQCYVVGSDEYCFKAGDKRVNAHVGLSALHTMFVRYHNLLCDRLRPLHQDWTDEKMYQEARRIVIAILQSITQNEYFKILFPAAGSVTHVDKLKEDVDNYAYDSSLDPTLANVFSTAAFRFGHSQVSGNLTLGGTLVLTKDLFMRSEEILSSLKDVVVGQMEEQLFRTDRWYADALTNHLDEQPGVPQSGWDLAALNIQRGRDHGLPPYNEWRKYYGLAPITSFADMPSGKNRLEKLYATTDDMDIYTAGLAEQPMGGSKVSEIFTYIIAEAFYKIKFGDRFWYENTATEHDSTRFTSEQITEISKVTLAKVVCDTVSDVEDILPTLFKLESSSNALTACTALDDINIEEFWA